MKSTHKNHSNYLDPSRLILFYAILAFIFGFFALRLFSLQIVQGKAFLSQAEENRTTRINIQTQRGIILDRNGSSRQWLARHDNDRPAAAKRAEPARGIAWREYLDQSHVNGG